MVKEGACTDPCPFTYKVISFNTKFKKKNSHHKSKSGSQSCNTPGLCRTTLLTHTGTQSRFSIASCLKDQVSFRKSLRTGSFIYFSWKTCSLLVSSEGCVFVGRVSTARERGGGESFADSWWWFQEFLGCALVLVYLCMSPREDMASTLRQIQGREHSLPCS